MTAITTGATLEWRRALEFDARTGRSQFVLDGDGAAGPSPVELLAAALAGCMAVDVVDIVTKGRHAIRSLRAELAAERAADPPRRVTAVRLHFVLSGQVPTGAVDRALQLSRDKYCSVWHSFRQDIPLAATFEVRP